MFSYSHWEPVELHRQPEDDQGGRQLLSAGAVLWYRFAAAQRRERKEARDGSSIQQMLLFGSEPGELCVRWCSCGVPWLPWAVHSLPTPSLPASPCPDALICIFLGVAPEGPPSHWPRKVNSEINKKILSKHIFHPVGGGSLWSARLKTAQHQGRRNMPLLCYWATVLKPCT